MVDWWLIGQASQAVLAVARDFCPSLVLPGQKWIAARHFPALTKRLRSDWTIVEHVLRIADGHRRISAKPLKSKSIQH
jgi:hypothetical protein